MITKDKTQILMIHNFLFCKQTIFPMSRIIHKIILVITLPASLILELEDFTKKKNKTVLSSF